MGSAASATRLTAVRRGGTTCPETRCGCSPLQRQEPLVRRRLLDEFGIEVGAGLGPLAGQIWRVGLMGSGSTSSNVLLFLAALDDILHS